MAKAQPAVANQGSTRIRSDREAQEIGDAAAVFAHAGGQLGLGSPSCSISARYPWARSMGFRSSRWMFSTRAIWAWA